jgi:ABC-type Fe3+/spermidine/putrescine transport system ATPase subunit
MIKAKKVFFSYQNTFSLKNISLNVKEGQILGVIGQSGSGKSTLLKILGGFLDLESGEVLFENMPLIPPSKKLIAGNEKIKTVTQANTLFPNVSIFENIAYELRYFKSNYQTKRIKSLSKILNIGHLLEKLPRELSGGELQRVMIAKAIADEPKVLLLDEPFSNLDNIIKKKILIELKRVLKIEQIACVFVTHEISDAFGLVDELIILKNGRVIQKGTSENLYFQPKNVYVGLLTGDGFLLNNLNLVEKKYEKIPYFLRPENFVIDQSSKIIANVTHSIFKGSYFEIHVELNDESFYLKNHNAIVIGSKINLKLISEPVVF